MPRLLRVLQVLDLGERYLKHYNTRHLGRELKPFSAQLAGLVADGECAAHILAPFLAKHGFESALVFADDSHSQSKWLEEYSSLASDMPFAPEGILRLQIDSFRPDILLINNPVRFDTRFLSSLSHSPDLVIGAWSDSITDRVDWSGFDIILSGLTALCELAPKLGAKESCKFLPGFPHHLLGSNAAIIPEYDFLFCGAWSLREHQKRNFYLDQIAGVSEREGFRCAYFLDDESQSLTPDVEKRQLGPRYGIDRFRSLALGKILFEARIRRVASYSESPVAEAVDFDLGKNEVVSALLFEATGSGRLLLVEQSDDLHQYYEPDLEVVTFRDSADLFAKISYFLKHEEERKAIAQRGMERCLTDHTIEKRAKQLTEVIGDLLQKKRREQVAISLRDPLRAEESLPVFPANESDRILLEQVLKMLNHGRSGRAIALMNDPYLSSLPHASLRYLRAVAFARLGEIEIAKHILSETIQSSLLLTKAKFLLTEIQNINYSSDLISRFEIEGVHQAPTLAHSESKANQPVENLSLSPFEVERISEMRLDFSLQPPSEPSDNQVHSQSATMDSPAEEQSDPVDEAEEISVPSLGSASSTQISTERDGELISSLLDKSLDALKEGDPATALEHTEEARALSSSVQDLFYLRAICLIQLRAGSYLSLAKESLVKELELFPENTPARRLLDEVETELGRTESK